MLLTKLINVNKLVAMFSKILTCLLIFFMILSPFETRTRVTMTSRENYQDSVKLVIKEIKDYRAQVLKKLDKQ